MSSNLFGQFKIYPRGFLGAKLEPVLINQRPTKPQRLQYDVSMFDANEPQMITANMAIEESYTALVRKDVLSSDFDFREKTLRAILKAFGTTDFEGWYMAQYQSPSFGKDQRDFLEDCLNFAYCGKRKLSLQNWDAILEASADKISELELPEHARNVFQKRFVRELSPSNRHSIAQVVQLWLEKPNGFTDLLYTAHILFGIKR